MQPNVTFSVSRQCIAEEIPFTGTYSEPLSEVKPFGNTRRTVLYPLSEKLRQFRRVGQPAIGARLL